MATPTSGVQLEAPITKLWAQDIQAKRQPDPWRALNSAEIRTFSSTANAKVILGLAQVATPGAVLVNGPSQDNPNFASDEVDTAVTYMFMHDGVDRYPYVIKGSYRGTSGNMIVISYVADIVREYRDGTTKLVVVEKGSGLADYDWA